MDHGTQQQGTRKKESFPQFYYTTSKNGDLINCGLDGLSVIVMIRLILIMSF